MENTFTFEALNLKSHFKRAVANMGYSQPTTIQAQVYNVVLSGRDVMGIAQTGTGKTLAYLLPLMQLWRYDARHPAQMLVLVPTRELVAQVLEVAQSLAGDCGMRCVGVYGGVGMQPQAQRISEGADLVVGTPGRLLDLVLNGHLRLGGVKRLVLDEVDEMLQVGFRTQIGRVLDLLPRRRQNLLFSATMNQEVRDLANIHFNGPALIEAAPPGKPAQAVTQLRYDAPNFSTKVNLLLHLLRSDHEMRRMLVFVDTKDLCDRLFEALADSLAEQPIADLQFDYLHSGRTQSQRFRTLEAFKQGALQMLVATDLVSRGIDFEGVAYVVSFDVPREADQYVHRIGRAGRVSAEAKEGTPGTAYAFVGRGEGEAFDAVQLAMGQTVELLPLPEQVPTAPDQPWEKPQVKMRNQLAKIPKHKPNP